MQSIKLKSGNEMPQLGLGTWQMHGEDCKSAVKKSVELGYKHIDTALVYNNQESIAEALKELNRENLFITSKVWRDDLSYNGVIEQANLILEQLQLEYIDLLLIHWPNSQFSLEETFKAFKELIDQGKVKQVGVSNFTINHLEKAKEFLNLITINQVEFNPYLNQEKLLNYCKEKGIALTAYCPLSRGELLNDPILKEIAEKHNKTVAQITLRWLIQKNIIAIPKSRSEERIKENLDIFDFNLEEEDMQKINSLNKDFRHCNPAFAEFDN